jgi:hypothetical protein
MDDSERPRGGDFNPLRGKEALVYLNRARNHIDVDNVEDTKNVLLHPREVDYGAQYDP